MAMRFSIRGIHLPCARVSLISCNFFRLFKFCHNLKVFLSLPARSYFEILFNCSDLLKHHKTFNLEIIEFWLFPSLAIYVIWILTIGKIGFVVLRIVVSVNRCYVNHWTTEFVVGATGFPKGSANSHDGCVNLLFHKTVAENWKNLDQATPPPPNGSANDLRSTLEKESLIFHTFFQHL